MRFSSFIDKKNKQARDELSIIKDILEQEGDFEVKNFVKEESPYLYLKSPTDKGLNFEGIRIYKIGSSLAYRVQNESDTEPYGAAYSLNIEDIFSDLITDMSSEKAAKEIKKAVIEEFKNFFQKSVEAQEELNSGSGDPQSKIIVNGTSGDLSNSM